MLLNVIFPTEQFNEAIKDGSVGQKLGRIWRTSNLRQSILQSRTASSSNPYH